MKVVKGWQKRVTCHGCKAILDVELRDLAWSRWGGTQAGRRAPLGFGINCPQCGSGFAVDVPEVIERKAREELLRVMAPLAPRTKRLS